MKNILFSIDIMIDSAETSCRFMVTDGGFNQWVEFERPSKCELQLLKSGGLK